ncbi:MAG: adenylate/guanylate cyclase domain-containing protein [Gammaproteobacteria bacterium]|nr:MAG: adenylate/guanylate cyclase domain-containing protein [Gammaproteobacteria bacterium]
MPKNIVDQSLVAHHNVETLFDGELRIISILFATIHNISQLYDKSNPQQVHDYINSYFSLMAKCIEEHKGIVDKFVGGSILAIFGAPISSIENQKNSVFCALSMMEQLETFNAENREKIGFEIKLGVGIHSGETVIGNIGSKQYITYTAIGDTVNTASRIVDLTKGIRNTVLITDSIYPLVQECVVTESIGETKVRGKENSINLYKVLKKRI